MRILARVRPGRSKVFLVNKRLIDSLWCLNGWHLVKKVAGNWKPRRPLSSESRKCRPYSLLFTHHIHVPTTRKHSQSQAWFFSIWFCPHRPSQSAIMEVHLRQPGELKGPKQPWIGCPFLELLTTGSSLSPLGYCAWTVPCICAGGVGWMILINLCVLSVLRRALQ
jgi:hypothetical protein